MTNWPFWGGIIFVPPPAPLEVWPAVRDYIVNAINLQPKFSGVAKEPNLIETYFSARVVPLAIYFLPLSSLSPSVSLTISSPSISSSLAACLWQFCLLFPFPLYPLIHGTSLLHILLVHRVCSSRKSCSTGSGSSLRIVRIVWPWASCSHVCPSYVTLRGQFSVRFTV